jgi:hypothetical protein
MIKLFKKKTARPSTDFSQFFVLSKSAEKKKILKEVVRKANKDQKQLYQST